MIVYAIILRERACFVSDQIVNFSTTISREVKDLLERYCKSKGVRMNHFVESAIFEKLEDLMDSEIIGEREFEDTVEWKRNG
jgi:hypothetical protein